MDSQIKIRKKEILTVMYKVHLDIHSLYLKINFFTQLVPFRNQSHVHIQISLFTPDSVLLVFLLANLRSFSTVMASKLAHIKTIKTLTAEGYHFYYYLIAE